MRRLIVAATLALASVSSLPALADEPSPTTVPSAEEASDGPSSPTPPAVSAQGDSESSDRGSADPSSGSSSPRSAEAIARDPKHQTPPLGLFPMRDDALIDPRMARGWGEGAPRWFVATTVDLGFVYGRPRASIGYGKPFTSWFGLDVNPLATSNGLGAYGGLRLELPFFDLRGGVRYFSAFNRTYLAPREQYDRLAIETESAAGAAKVLTYEAEADSSLPIGPGNLLMRGSVSYVTNVPEGLNVFEETLRVIVQPPLVWRARGGYAFRFGKYQQHSLAVVADFLHVPARDDYRTLRVGPVIRFVLSRRVEVRGSFVTTAYSIDKIGLLGGDFTELGVRYRWATE